MFSQLDRVGSGSKVPQGNRTAGDIYNARDAGEHLLNEITGVTSKEQSTNPHPTKEVTAQGL